MRVVARSTAVALLTFAVAVGLALSTTMTSVVLAATALIMGGTGHPLSVPGDTPAFIADYINGANTNYITPSGLCTGGNPGCNLVAAYTPEQFRFDTGFADMTFDESVAAGRANLDNCIRHISCTVTPAPYTATGNQTLTDTTFVVFGYSQSATVATEEKRFLAANPVPGTTVNFDIIANPNKPNGGILERFEGLKIPFIGVTFNGATPTDTGMLTADTARQYDGWTDWPTNSLNLLADINAGFGIFYLHGNYFGVGTPVQQGQYGDTTYWLIATPVLPVLMPLEQVPFVGAPLAATLDPFFRVFVETGYNRTINPGQPTPTQWLYFPNPIQTVVNLAVAIPTGLDNGISVITGNPANRPFGTAIPGPYGVGGPRVDTGCGTPPCGPPTPSFAVASSNVISSSSTASLAAQTPAPQEQKPTTPKPLASPFDIKPNAKPSISASANAATSVSKPAAPKPAVLNKLASSIAKAFKKPAPTKPGASGDTASTTGNK